MRSMILAVAAAASLAFTAGAQAMPAGTIVVVPAAPVTLVGAACGPGFHLNPRGFCVRNFARPYVAYPAYGYYRPYARCGLRIGPIGIGGPC